MLWAILGISLVTSFLSVADPQGTWQWLRTEYVDGSSVAASNPNVYTLSLLDDRHLTFQADCNSGSGAYLIAGSRIAIQPGPMTLAECGPQSQGDVFLSDLAQAVSYAVTGDQLVLNTRGGGASMSFNRMPPPALTGVQWQVTGINNGHGGVMSVLAETQVTATFGEDGTVTGSTGCNSFQAPYMADDASLSVGPIITTRGACASDAANTQEQAFLAALAAASTYEFSGQQLKVRDADGSTQLSLVPSPD
jgi:heat shock protein HslJ